MTRQSRQFDLGGADGEPPADAYLLLRWMINSPVGATRYEDDEGSPAGGGAGFKGAETGAAAMPVAPKTVVAESG